MNSSLNINCDLGEGFANDSLIMPLIDACNIACGGHAGNPDTIRHTIRLANAHQVKIGAHPSFPDRENFGRIPMDLSPAELSESLLSQIKDFHQIAQEENTQIHHIKLHGALYNLAAVDLKTAQVVVDSFRKLDFPFKIFTLEKSILAKLASDSFEIVSEAFMDRQYQDDLRLMPRSKPGAVMTDQHKVWEQYRGLMEDEMIETVSGERKKMQAQTVCIHGDQPNTVAHLKYIQKQIENR